MNVILMRKSVRVLLQPQTWIVKFKQTMPSFVLRVTLSGQRRNLVG